MFVPAYTMEEVFAGLEQAFKSNFFLNKLGLKCLTDEPTMECGDCWEEISNCNCYHLKIDEIVPYLKQLYSSDDPAAKTSSIQFILDTDRIYLTLEKIEENLKEWNGIEEETAMGQFCIYGKVLWNESEINSMEGVCA